ncbi:MAG: hypothetical protein ACP6IP_03910 [Candidatus Njordarchaeia archaeon]
MLNGKYNILIGVEEEIFIVNQSGFLAPYSEKIANRLLEIVRENSEILELARKYLKGIQWEATPSQLEYVTRPLPPQELFEAVKFARALLSQAAEDLDLLIYPASVHPIQSKPYPMNGTHINISVFKDNKPVSKRMIFHMFRHIRNHLPEIIAISANTDIVGSRKSKFKSSRLAYSKVLKKSNKGELRKIKYFVRPRKHRDITRYGILFEKYKKKESKIIIDEMGDRLLDITVRGPYTNILGDSDKKFSETRIEIRAIDNQLNTEYLSDIIKILAALTMEAVDTYVENRILDERKHLDYNRAKAIEEGIHATFLDEEGREKTARESFLEMLQRINKYLEKLKLDLKTSIKNGIPEIENKERPVIVDQNRRITELQTSGRIFLTARITDETVGYTITGKEKILKPKTIITGLIIPHYELELDTEKGMLKRIKKIKIKHWIITDKYYIPYSEKIVIRNMRGPIKQYYKKIRNLIETLNTTS